MFSVTGWYKCDCQLCTGYDTRCKRSKFLLYVDVTLFVLAILAVITIPVALAIHFDCKK